MQITDRSKDVIKSGGNGFPPSRLKIGDGASLGGGSGGDRHRHPKWDERPLLIVVLKPGATPTKTACWRILRGQIAKWWLPDAMPLLTEYRIPLPAKSAKPNCAAASRILNSRPEVGTFMRSQLLCARLALAALVLALFAAAAATAAVRLGALPFESGLTIMAGATAMGLIALLLALIWLPGPELQPGRGQAGRPGGAFRQLAAAVAAAAYPVHGPDLARHS